MKKLKLKLDGKEMLSKEQMKKINGGYGGPCFAGAWCKNYTVYVSCNSVATNGHCYGEDNLGVMCYGDGFLEATTCDSI